MQASSKKAVKNLHVSAVQDISPHLRRITLAGKQLTGFPNDETGGYIKLIFNDSRYYKPLMRTYTIRNTRIEELEIDVDFVLHDDGGPASLWAKHVQAGSTVEITGPGPKKLASPTADWFLFVGDMTALPAICVNLEQLPADARGVAVLEVISESDIQPIRKPSNIAIKWIVNSTPGLNTEILVDAVTALPWRAGNPAIWTACEFKAMKKLRNFYVKEKGINRKAFYISSYWKHGVSEDEHKVIKRDDAELLTH